LRAEDKVEAPTQSICRRACEAQNLKGKKKLSCLVEKCSLPESGASRKPFGPKLRCILSRETAVLQQTQIKTWKMFTNEKAKSPYY
jgi:hypothetical protein